MMGYENVIDSVFYFGISSFDAYSPIMQTRTQTNTKMELLGKPEPSRSKVNADKNLERVVVVLKIPHEEREFLARLLDATGYPNQRRLVFDALYEFADQWGISQDGVPTYVGLDKRVERLESGVQELNLLMKRLMQLLAAYERSFQLFTMRNKSKPPMIPTKGEAAK